MTDQPQPSPDLVERVCRALAKADGCDFDEVCGVDADPDEGYCDSGTCVASGWEDHDADMVRRYYRSRATSVIPLIQADTEAQIVALIAKHGIASCNCPTKSPEAAFHELTCPYYRVALILDDIERGGHRESE